MLIPDDQALDALLKRLHLAFIRRNWRDVVERAEREQWSYRDFLAILAGEEVAHRAQTGIARRTRHARCSSAGRPFRCPGSPGGSCLLRGSSRAIPWRAVAAAVAQDETNEVEARGRDERG